ENTRDSTWRRLSQDVCQRAEPLPPTRLVAKENFLAQRENDLERDETDHDQLEELGALVLNEVDHNLEVLLDQLNFVLDRLVAITDLERHAQVAIELVVDLALPSRAGRVEKGQ